jgi:hypothetical protein
MSRQTGFAWGVIWAVAVCPFVGGRAWAEESPAPAMAAGGSVPTTAIYAEPTNQSVWVLGHSEDRTEKVTTASGETEERTVKARVPDGWQEVPVFTPKVLTSVSPEVTRPVAAPPVFIAPVPVAPAAVVLTPVSPQFSVPVVSMPPLVVSAPVRSYSMTGTPTFAPPPPESSSPQQWKPPVGGPQAVTAGKPSSGY